ncbi:hypothetical protein Q5752_004158 [Cryptotrichosporon argae]
MADSQPFAESKSPAAVPTNVVTYKGRRMPARIDPDASVGRVVEIMTNAFQAPEHHITLALRDEEDNLVTQATLPAKVASKEILKLVPSPVSEALAVVASLQSAMHGHLSTDSPQRGQDGTDVIPPKLALFNLQKFIKEEDFAIEFMLKGGPKMLVRLIERDEGGLSGNSLAYALQGIRGIMEFEHGWSDFTDDFIDRIILVLASPSAPNILRPATIILRKLVIASPSAQQTEGGGSTYTRKGKARDVEEGINSYGFERVYSRVRVVGNKVPDEQGGTGPEKVFRCIVKRLEGTRDLELVAQSLAFINTCLRVAQQENSKRYTELVGILETLGTRKYVTRLMPNCANNIVEARILDFQSRYATILRQRALRPVRPTHNVYHDRLLSEIWVAGKLEPYDPRDGSVRKSAQTVQSHEVGGMRSWAGWAKAGLMPEQPVDLLNLVEAELFRPIGELGLECFHYFAMHEEMFYSVVLEQQARLPERRCPLGRASNDCVRILYEHYKVSQATHRGASHFQPFLLNFNRLHYLVLKFFIRMWQESESRLEDFDRVSYLVRSQIHLSLTDEMSKTWLDLERDFLDSDYRSIRDRQMQLADKEDGMLERSAIRELKEKVNKEAYDVVSEQRVACMIQGSWFNSANILLPGVHTSVRATSAKPLRFVRLHPNKRTIAWGEFAKRTDAPPSFESLRERIDVANITDIRLSTGCAINSRSPNLVSKLSFSLMASDNLSLLDLDAVHAAQMAEWTDGLRIVKGEGGMAHPESAGFVHVLTELSLKVRLLDITGDGIEIPSKVSFGTAPTSTDFWFAN